MRFRRPSGLWLGVMLSVAGLGASGAGESAGAAAGAAQRVGPPEASAAAVADAVQRQDTQAVLSLLKTRADVNAPQGDGTTALHWAAYLADAEMTTLLVRAGANVNARNSLGVTPLALAAQQGSAVVIEQLLEAGAEPNDPVNLVNAAETPLMHAARVGKRRRREGARDGRAPT